MPTVFFPTCAILSARFDEIASELRWVTEILRERVRARAGYKLSPKILRVYSFLYPLRYGDRPEVVCMKHNVCGADSYVRTGTHTGDPDVNV